jgi:hypothetical protein
LNVAKREAAQGVRGGLCFAAFVLNTGRNIMNRRQRRDFLLLVTLAAATTMPAWGQTLAPAVGPDSAIQGAASIPDLSGIWGRNGVAFEPPSSGSGPVVGKLRRPDGTLLVSPFVGNYTNPILGPQAAEAVKKFGEMELSGVVPPTPTNQCWPDPTPFVFYNERGIQMIQQRGEVVLLYLHDQEFRHVRMNVPHSAHPTPSWQGESVGRYEGDTLVIDTIGQKVGPLSMVDRYGTPFSAALHVIERYRLIDGAMARDLQRKHESSYYGAGRSSPFTNDTTKPGLQVEITVDDPATFTMPWSALVTYRHVLGEWPEVVCAENTRGGGSSWVSLVPHADKPDF